MSQAAQGGVLRNRLSQVTRVDSHRSGGLAFNSRQGQGQRGIAVPHIPYSNSDDRGDNYRGYREGNPETEDYPEDASYKEYPEEESEEWGDFEEGYGGEEDPNDSWDYYETEEHDVKEEAEEGEYLDDAPGTKRKRPHSDLWPDTRSVGSILVERAKPAAGRGGLRRMEHSDMAPRQNMFQQSNMVRNHYEPNEEAAASALVELRPQIHSTYTMAGTPVQPVRQQVLRVGSYITPRQTRTTRTPMINSSTVRGGEQQLVRQRAPQPGFPANFRSMTVVHQASPNTLALRTTPEQPAMPNFMPVRFMIPSAQKHGEQSIMVGTGAVNEQKPFAMVPPQRARLPGPTHMAGNLQGPTTPSSAGQTTLRSPIVQVGAKLVPPPNASPRAGQQLQQVPAGGVNSFLRPLSQEVAFQMRGSIMIRNPASSRIPSDVAVSSTGIHAQTSLEVRSPVSSISGSVMTQAAVKQEPGVVSSEGVPVPTYQRQQPQHPQSPQVTSLHHQIMQQQAVQQVQLFQHQQNQSFSKSQNAQSQHVFPHTDDSKCTFRFVTSLPVSSPMPSAQQQHHRPLQNVKIEPIKSSPVVKREPGSEEDVSAHIVVKKGIGSIIANKHVVDASKGPMEDTDPGDGLHGQELPLSPRGGRGSRGGRGRGTPRRGANRGGASVVLASQVAHQFHGMSPTKAEVQGSHAHGVQVGSSTPHQMQQGVSVMSQQTLSLDSMTVDLVDVPVIFFPNGSRMPLKLAEKDSYSVVVIQNGGCNGSRLTPMSTAFHDVAFVNHLAHRLTDVEENSYGNFMVGVRTGKLTPSHKVPDITPQPVLETTRESPATTQPVTSSETIMPPKAAPVPALHSIVPATYSGTSNAAQSVPQKPPEKHLEGEKTAGDAKASGQRLPATPAMKPGKCAVCEYCGNLSGNFIRCSRCNRSLPPNPKEVSDSDAKTYSTAIPQTGSSTVALRKMRFVKKSRKPDEPECLTLSSDEDEGEEEGAKSEPETVGKDQWPVPGRPPFAFRPPAPLGTGVRFLPNSQTVRFSSLRNASPVLRPPSQQVIVKPPDEPNKSATDPLPPGKLLRKWVVDGTLLLRPLSKAIEAQKNYYDEGVDEPFDSSSDCLSSAMPVALIPFRSAKGGSMKKMGTQVQLEDGKGGRVVGATAGGGGGGGGGSQSGGESSRSSDNERKDDDMEISDEEDGGYDGEGDGDEDGNGQGGDRRKKKDPVDGDPEALRFLPRSVRIGSYKSAVVGNVVVNAKGINIPMSTIKRHMNDTARNVTLRLTTDDVTGMWVHFAQKGGTPIIILYTTKDAARTVRKRLGMPPVESSVSGSGPFFCPSSRDESRRRILIFVDHDHVNDVSPKLKQFWENLKSNRGEAIYREISKEKAQDIMARAIRNSSLVRTQERTMDGIEFGDEVRLESRVIAYGEMRRPLLKPLAPRVTLDSTGQPVKLFTYKPQNIGNCRSQGGSVEIFLDDYNCLEEEQFLNDTVIDFYLKYVVNEFLEPEVRKKIFVFSTYFYNRLTNRKAANKKSEEKMNAAEKRHERVKQWTKGVDLFSKDFIVVPINENSHWFLAIICFPALKSAVRASDNTPVTIVPVKKSKKMPKDAAVKKPDVKDPEAKGESPKKIFHVGSTTITPKKAGAGSEESGGIPGLTLASSEATSPSSSGNNGNISAALSSAIGNLKQAEISEIDDHNEDRDEAEGDDEELDEDFSDEFAEPGKSDENDEAVKTDAAEESESPKNGEPKVKEEAMLDEPVKQPCILIFDSLRGNCKSRSRIVATLREYLEVEWRRKQGEEDPGPTPRFGADTMRGHSVICPQQDNFSDCGLYLLQYVESFFVGEKRVTSFRLPLKDLQDWFTPERMRRKRKELSQLFIELTRQSNPEVAESIPLLQFDCDQFEVGPSMKEYKRSLMDSLYTTRRKEKEQGDGEDGAEQDQSSGANGEEEQQLAGAEMSSTGKEAGENGPTATEEAKADEQSPSKKKKRGFCFTIPPLSATPTLNQQETPSPSTEDGPAEEDVSKTKKRKLSPNLISDSADSTS